MFPLGVPKELEDEANKWYSDYIELMEYRKNPFRGNEKCDGCLLSMGKEEDAIYFGINKVMAKGLEYNDNNNNSADQLLYPCKIHRFECPYEKEKRKPNAKFDVNDLFTLDDIADLAELALSRAESMTKNNEIIYEADFEAGRVKQIHTNFYIDHCSSSIECPLEEELSKVTRPSKVPIRSAQDVIHALTARETLGALLEQELEKNEEYLKYKDYLLNFFMTIKDKVRIEDLFITPNYPSAGNNRQQQYSNKCSLCQGFANIYCVNCNNVWLCIDHWRQHRTAVHYQFK